MADKRTRHKYISIVDPNFPFAAREAYNSLRTNVQYSVSPLNGKIIAITSSNAGEGKSSVSANLAISLAQTSAKVLLIDADLRKPVIHKYLKLNNTSGLSNFIVGFDTLSDALKRNVHPNLDVMTSGPIPPNPSELLGSESMKAFIDKISDAYDYIIIDTPPINVVTDMAAMASIITGVLLVSFFASTTTDDVRRAKEALDVVKAKILGLVVVGVDGKKIHGSYSRKYYKKYYSYK